MEVDYDVRRAKTCKLGVKEVDGDRCSDGRRRRGGRGRRGGCRRRRGRRSQNGTAGWRGCLPRPESLAVVLHDRAAEEAAEADAADVDDDADATLRGALQRIRGNAARREADGVSTNEPRRNDRARRALELVVLARGGS